ncbi:MAG: hypothetical protein H0U90_02485 [Actinobacteria bacterium]|nr:hypothetical protein [Actinomycetota bacterium]
MRGRLVLALALGLAALAVPSAAQAAGGHVEAELALDRALTLFEPKGARAAQGGETRPGPHDATLVLRDLAARLADLPARDRALAERLLARPTDGFDAFKRYTAPARHVCDATTCVWWVNRTADAPSLVDRNSNGVPDWVDATRATFRAVWAAEVGRYGYARPLADNRGHRGRHRRKLDVYVADLGSRGIYGYCTTDDPRRSSSRSVSAYCAVDDDFSRAQFGGATTGVAALKVTAAHEFFHAVQYAYDWLEDLWLMEGSAAWVESEVYPSIHDNLQYLRRSPLSSDGFSHSLDHDEPNAARAESGLTYGAWIWWRFLAERHGRGIVRDVWNRARGTTYSIQATQAALAARGEPFGTVFADFGAANLLPGASYLNGALYDAQPGVGPVPPSVSLGTGTLSTGVVSLPMPHLSNDLYAFRPGSGLGASAKLAVSVQLGLPATRRSATLVLHRTNGTVERLPFALDAVGAGSLGALDFGPGQVQSVTLLLTNAGLEFGSCGQARQPPFFSCGGTPLDDATFSFTALATP